MITYLKPNVQEHTVKGERKLKALIYFNPDKWVEIPVTYHYSDSIDLIGRYDVVAFCQNVHNADDLYNDVRVSVQEDMKDLRISNFKLVIE